MVERDRARLRGERRELPVYLLRLGLLHPEGGEERVRGLAALDGVDQVPDSRRDARTLALQGRALDRGLGVAPLQALQRQGDGAGDDLLVEGLGQSVEKHAVEVLLPDGHAVRADGVAARVVIAAAVEIHPRPVGTGAVAPREGD